MNPMVITKVRQLWNVLMRKKKPKFVGEIQDLIDSYPSKSIRAKSGDIGVSYQDYNA